MATFCFQYQVQSESRDTKKYGTPSHINIYEAILLTIFSSIKQYLMVVMLMNGNLIQIYNNSFICKTILNGCKL